MEISELARRRTAAVFVALAVATISAAALVSAAPSDRLEHRSARRYLHSPTWGGLFGSELRGPRKDNGNGQDGSGPVATAHYAGGKRIESGAALAAAPDARLYRTGVGGWEPTVGITRDGAIFFQARQANLHPEVLRSTDDGRSWEIVTPQVGGQPAQEFSIDPYLFVDERTDRVFTNNLTFAFTCSQLSFSDDKGKTWDHSAVCGEFDHQNMFSGPAVVSEPIGYPNIVYYCAITGGVGSSTSTATGCLRSLDGGRTFTPTGTLPYLGDWPDCDGGTGHGHVGPDGTVYLPGGCGQPVVVVSRDEGMTWEKVQVARNGMAKEGGIPGHEAGVGTDAKGNVYYTWLGEDRLPYLAVSRDRGRTWSKPLMVGPPGLRQSVLPNIAVAPKGGVAIVYVGSPVPHSAPRKTWHWNGYITMTTSALSGNPIFYSGPVNDPADPLIRGECDVIRCNTLGDFFDIAIAPDGTPWAALVDSCLDEGRCLEFDLLGLRGEGVLGRFVGGPPLR